MKKILIASTALVAAGFITTGSASASEKINLQLGGFSKWWVVGQWNNGDYTKALGKDYNNVDVKGDNEVWFDGSTKLDNGLQVGFHAELEAGGHTDQTSDTIDASYVYVAGGFGKAIIGTLQNGTYLLHNTAPDAAGNWNEGGIMTGGFAIAQPATVASINPTKNYNTTAIATDDKSEGITYVAPTFYGLTVGGSYKPSSREDNRNTVDLKKQTASEIYGAAAMYANTFGGVGVKADAGWATYSVETAGSHIDAKSGVNEYSTGLNLSYAGFTLGGSYRKVSADAAVNVLDGNAYDAGLSYASGPYAVSFAYFHSNVKGGTAAIGTTINSAGSTEAGAKDKITAYQVSGKYTLGAGVDALASVGYVDFKDGAAGSTYANGDSNKGFVAMTGLSLTF